MDKFFFQQEVVFSYFEKFIRSIHYFVLVSRDFQLFTNLKPAIPKMKECVFAE